MGILRRLEWWLFKVERDLDSHVHSIGLVLKLVREQFRHRRWVQQVRDEVARQQRLEGGFWRKRGQFVNRSSARHKHIYEGRAVRMGAF